MKQKTPVPEPKHAKGENSEAIKQIFTFGSGALFTKSADSLPANERQILGALRRFYSYRHNGFLLVEALDICTRNNVNPPAWVLVAINRGFGKFGEGVVNLERALSMGKSNLKEYHQYRDEQPVMQEVQEKINRDPKRRIAPACKDVSNKHNLNRDTVEKQYRRMWHGFYEYVKGKKNP